MINNQGKVRFRLFEGSMNADILIGFCKRLVKSVKRNISDPGQPRVHHAKVFKAWLREHEDEIEVFYLPFCSPELNPDEYLNCDLKAGVHSGKPVRSKERSKKKILLHMRMLQKRHKRVARYFEIR